MEGMAAGGVVAAVASIIGMLISEGRADEAQQLRMKMAAEYGDEILPMLEQAVAEQAGPSAFEGMRESPDARERQVSVDDELAAIYESGGNTAADQAAYDLSQRRVAAMGAGQAQDIAMSAARRGQSGGPLASVLAANVGQQQLDTLGAMNAQQAADGRNRALGALQSRAGLASNIRGQDWGALSARAQAMDMQNRFNASQRQGASMYNAGLPQQNFNNRMGLIGARNNARSGVAAGLDASGAAARQTAAGLGNAALSYGAAWDWGQDKEKK